MKLHQLQPGARFRVPRLNLECTLIACNECRARVRIHRGKRHVALIDRQGNRREFEADQSSDTSWTPYVDVVPISEADRMKG